MAVTNSTGPHLRIVGPWNYSISCAIGLVLMTFWVFGLLLNGLILFTFLKTPKMRSPTNLFILGLIMNDFTLTFFGHPMDATAAFVGRWPFGHIGCQLYGFAMFFTGLNAISVLTAIAVDRYIVIAKPLYASKITKRVAFLSLMVCAAHALLWTVPPLFGWNRYVLEGGGLSCSVDFESRETSDRVYQISIFISSYFLPIALILFCYYHVYMTVRHVSRNTTFGKDSDVAKKNRKVEEKMFRTCLAMFGGFLFAWTPYAIVALYVTFGDPHRVPTLILTTLAVWAKSSVVVDPSIYVFTNPMFRIAMAAHVPCQPLKNFLLPKEDDDDDEKPEPNRRGSAVAPAQEEADV
uniref:XenopsinA n=1 Tax=Stylochus ellipticus TaxID=1385436 RepID=A0A2D3VF54_9PLAT|nr:TPA_inf: xenopsinA [Stylochus ellipticus]